MSEISEAELPVYSVRISQRARRLALTVYPGGRVVLTKPVFAKEEEVKRFIASRVEWLERARERSARLTPVSPLGKRAYREHRARALSLVRERLEYFNTQYRVRIGTVSIGRAKSRWGSCTRNGNLRFNYRIVFLDTALVDYIVVHELCHCKEFNHSKAFWALVAETIPDYAKCRQRLRLIA